MTELAQTYLGNYLKDIELKERVEQSLATNCCLEVELTQDDSLKSRVHAKSSEGTTVGIIKERGWSLTEGDVFKTENDQLLLIHIQAQQFIVLSFSTQQPGYEIALVHLGHALGNHHYPIFVTKDKIYIQLVTDKEVIEATIYSFKIPGLLVTYELRSPAQQLTFQKDSHEHHSHH